MFKVLIKANSHNRIRVLKGCFQKNIKHNVLNFDIFIYLDSDSSRTPSPPYYNLGAHADTIRHEEEP